MPTTSKMPRSRCELCLLELLDARRLLSATPTNFDQYMLEVINRARANPTAEAARLGIDLNEGLAAGTISATPKQPLAFNPDLLQSSLGYTNTLLGAYNYFDHYYQNTTPQTRMTAAGYPSSYTSGENIAVRFSTGPYPVSQSVVDQEHSDLFIDSGEPGRGHRVNLMDGSYKEIGIGVVAGSNYQGVDTPPDHTAYNAVLTTQDFAASTTDGNPFLTGVAYNDTVTADHFYTPGEGLGGVTVNAVNSTTHAVFSATTWASGGYSLEVPAGTYIVTFSGSSLSHPIGYLDVVGSSNVEQDALVQDVSSVVANGTLTVTGSASSDTISLSEGGGNLTVTKNGVIETIPQSGVSLVVLAGAAGGDSITVNAGVTISTLVHGGHGPDTLVSSAANVTLVGGKGIDSLHATVGGDLLLGGKGSDSLTGGPGGDTLSAGLGHNSLMGGTGNDVFFAINQSSDTIVGGGGNDTAHADAIDSILSVKTVLNV